LTLVEFSAILNLAKIKIDFAFDKTTTQLETRKYNFTVWTEMLDDALQHVCTGHNMTHHTYQFSVASDHKQTKKYHTFSSLSCSNMILSKNVLTWSQSVVGKLA
jgi:hypothetical protein